MRLTTLYDRVTAGIIAELEAGAVPWTQPWSTAPTDSVLPLNAVTRRPYSGVNIPILWASAAANGFDRHAWLTFKQAAERGAHVTRGQRATTVVFTRMLTTDPDNDDATMIPMLRTYALFNVSQVDGLTNIAESGRPMTTRSDVDALITATHAAVTFGGNEAYYVESVDTITMPRPSAFLSRNSYYATLLHELGHWTGHRSRLARELNNRFGTRVYAAEELVAELTSAFVCATLGLTGELRHAGYIADWIRLLRDDNRAIFTAAAHASRAANFIMAPRQQPPAPTRTANHLQRRLPRPNLRRHDVR